MDIAVTTVYYVQWERYHCLTHRRNRYANEAPCNGDFRRNLRTQTDKVVKQKPWMCWETSPSTPEPERYILNVSEQTSRFPQRTLQRRWTWRPKRKRRMMKTHLTSGPSGWTQNTPIFSWMVWTVYYIILYDIIFHYIPLHYITIYYIILHYITLHYITLNYITYNYVKLHNIT